MYAGLRTTENNVAKAVTETWQNFLAQVELGGD